MNWERLNFNEIGYFCKSTKANTDFACYPLSIKIECIMGILSYYGIYSFQANDIKQFFSLLQIKSIHTGTIFVPSIRKIQTILEKMVGRHQLSIKESYFFISDFQMDEEIYASKIKEGYQKDYINGWLLYKKESIKKEAGSLPPL